MTDAMQAGEVTLFNQDAVAIFAPLHFCVKKSSAREVAPITSWALARASRALRLKIGVNSCNSRIILLATGQSRMALN
jgi:hypothetical protein